MKTPFKIFAVCVTFVCASALSSRNTFAGSATWQSAPATGDWNTATNWTPATAPNGPADTATFAVSTQTAVSTSANTEVNSIVFNAGASAFTITCSTPLTLTISGTGITNNSGITQNFVIAPGAAANQHGFIFFTNSATAGSSTTFTNLGGVVSGGAVGGETNFENTSTAGSATFNNNGGTVTGANGGATEFENNSTAANGTFNNNGASVSGANGGFTSFNQFTSGTSTAGSGTFINNGSAVSGAQGGATAFFSSSTAGSATFNNNGGTVTGANGGVTAFENNSTAANGTFNNNGSAVSGTLGGGTVFLGSSTAGNGTFTNNASAGNGAFFGTFGGFVNFFNTSTAGNGTFTNNASAVSGNGEGITAFFDTSTAGNSTITNNGGTVSGARGGVTQFLNSSTAGAATLIANGGTAGGGEGAGGIIFFQDDSTGGTARAEVSGNGALDLSRHNAPGVTIGSIEGSGNVFLGANNLTVGSNNLSTTLSGVIQDGGFNGGTGGSLTKIGTGTLTLSGTNTYTGPTAVNAGKVLVDGSIAASSGVAVAAGAILGGHGNVSAISGGGTIAPGNSPGILTGTHLDPSGGLSFTFEFTQAGSPTYSNAAASGNDVLRLTDSTPFTTALTSANKVTIDFSGASLLAGELFRGGFFTDTPTATSMVSGADFVYTGTGGFTVNFDGFVTEPVAAFAGGTVMNGTVLEFGIGSGTSVPDASSTWTLLLLSLAATFGLNLLLRGQSV